MNLKTYFLSLLIYSLACSVIYGQNYFEYHQMINEAEAHLGREAFEKSLETYSSVFSDFDYVFTKDFLIAAQVAFLAGDTTSVIHFLKSSIKAGYTCACIAKFPLFSWMSDSGHLDTLSEYEKMARPEYLRSIRLDLSWEWSRRYQKEQSLKRVGSEDVYKHHVENNFQRIRSLMDTLIFPSERVVGLDNQRLADKLNTCGASNTKVIVSLLHYDNPITQIGIDKFVNAIKTGHLHPRQFGSIFTFEKNLVSRLHNSKNYPDLPDYTFNFPFGVKSIHIEETNKQRAMFGICSLETEANKALVAKKYQIVIKFGYK